MPNDTYYGDQWQHKVINSETDADPAKSGLITTDVTANGKGFNPAFNDSN